MDCYSTGRESLGLEGLGLEAEISERLRKMQKVSDSKPSSPQALKPCFASRVTRHIAVALTAFALSGCYLLQAARGQMAISSGREPIQKAIDDPHTPSAVRTRLQMISEAREFA